MLELSTQEEQCYEKARKNGEVTFTLRAADISADLVVEFWVLVNGKVRELVKKGWSPAAAVDFVRQAHHIPPMYEGLLDDEKLRGAAQVAKAMRQHDGRKVAD